VRDDGIAMPQHKGWNVMIGIGIVRLDLFLKVTCGFNAYARRKIGNKTGICDPQFRLCWFKWDGEAICCHLPGLAPPV
jgi:hypothetical protein